MNNKIDIRDAFFDTIIDEEVLANAFWAIAIIINPGARNCINGKPATIRCAPPRAIVKTARNSRVVTTGAIIVCV